MATKSGTLNAQAQVPLLRANKIEELQNFVLLGAFSAFKRGTLNAQARF